MKKVMVSILVLFMFFTVSTLADKVLVYISGPEGMVKKIEQVFEKKYGDCLDVYHTGSGPLKQKVFTELMVGEIQADVIWGAEPLMYFQLMENDVLERYFPKGYERLKKAYQYGDGYFTASNARYGTIIYNAEKLSADEIPAVWSDLMGENWKSRIAMADGSQSAMAFALVGSIYNLENGKEILKALGNDEVFLTKMNIDAISKVQSGERDICIAPSDGAFRIIKSMKQKGVDSNLKILYPKDGAFSIQRPIAVVKKDRSAAELKIVHLFVDFAISDECQQISSGFGFASVMNDDESESAEEINEIYPDWETLLNNQEEILDFYTENVLD
ncbi:MAG TPA: extracellular solute-binding protein [Thermotogota bacterium]|nr:extracellular solute-binding protein [Thermotogota bacterium]HPJ89015.1 extracellular solute-binding protein [Thermotogota bacterium]HPR95526.1 extracellular solute-binding protein [Thermotogota bacterium]